MTEALSLPRGLADLPLEVTTFVGRKSDRIRIRERMSTSRLVTLTGFGGIGKTRLALRLAAELGRVFDSVHVISLAGLTDPDAVPEYVSAALGLQGRPTDSPTVAIVEYLQPRKALLVLDNCEHVVEAAAVLADTLLYACPGVRILATSREPLRIGGEVEYPVAPLTAPGPTTGEEPLHGYEAVQLFLDRARAVLPDFTLTDRNRTAVAAISRKLEGIPLALELAAAQLRTFSPTDLDAHLTQQWDFLGKGSRTAPFRHSTMAACIEWSVDLCTPAQRQLWAKASVFVEGFELDAAISVCSDPDVEEPVAETLASLVEKSIVITETRGDTTRYRMLPPIRHRGAVELDHLGDGAVVRHRHKDFYVSLLARAHDDWFGPLQLDWLDRLRRERGNVGLALKLCAADPSCTNDGLELAADLLEWGLVEGHFHQGRRSFERILASPTGDPETRARALRTASIWAAMEGDLIVAQQLVAEGLDLAAQFGEDTQALLGQAGGFVAVFAGEAERAAHLLSEANSHFIRTGNTAELAFCSNLLALAQSHLGHPETALEHLHAGLAATEVAGETWVRSWCLWVAGELARTQGDIHAASEAVSQSLRLKRLLAEPLGIAVLLESVAGLSVPTDPERAATLMGAAQNEWAKVDTSAQLLPLLKELHREWVDAALDLMGDGPFELATARGRALDQATAIAFALGEKPGPPHAQALAPQPATPVLTAREHQCAGLIHQGLSNQEIADALVISRRTAEGHVEHILTKLGFTGRAQIAAWFGEQTRE